MLGKERAMLGKERAMLGKERKMLKTGETFPEPSTTDDCRSVIDVCEMDTHYDYDTDFTIPPPMGRRLSITRILARKSVDWARYSLRKLPIRLTLGNLGFFAVILAIVMPRAFTYHITYPIFRLVFGTLYPAYASYKAVRTKNVKEYVKWMMYWIVFALFTSAETFTDVFFSFWFPFYYEIKIMLVLWLLSPATKGSSILYRRFVHPALIRREAEIDEALARATEQGYTAVLHLGTKGVNYATTVLMQTAIKNLPNALLSNLSPSTPERQSDPLSSLANHTPRKNSSRKDSVDSSSGRRSQCDDHKDCDTAASIIIEPSSDDEGQNDFVFDEAEPAATFENFKAPEMPRKSRRINRRKVITPKKERLRSYDEFSDGTDA